MLAKKKSVGPKKLQVKKSVHKISGDGTETVNTTKERTFATIQQTFEFHDHKISARSTHNTSRRQCLDKMEAIQLSPFSSPGQSLSPKSRKSLSPRVVNQKQVKKGAKNLQLDGLNLLKKVKVTCGKIPKSCKNKTKSTKKIKAEFENEFLKRMNKYSHIDDKKITQLSQQQMEASIRKIDRNNYFSKKQLKTKILKPRISTIVKMKQKIRQKCQQMYPFFNIDELNSWCAATLIQKFWRNYKTKKNIQKTMKFFTSPRNSAGSYKKIFQNIVALKCENNDENKSNLDQSSISFTKSFFSLTPASQKKQQQEKVFALEKQKKRNEMLLVTPQKSMINLKQLQVSDELSNNSQTKMKQIAQYIDIYREVTLKSKRQKKRKNNQRQNVFNFPESLSEKCLLQNLYKKRISNIGNFQDKKDNHQIINVFLPIKSSQRFKQNYTSPKKPKVIELQERFYTQAQDQQYISLTKTAKQPIKPEEQTVESIGNIANFIIQSLFEDFTKQWQQIGTKKILKKKKRIPGIVINQKTIYAYLNQLAEFIQNNNNDYFEQSFTKLNSKILLKIFRVMPEEDLFQNNEDEEEDDESSNFPVVPHAAFFEYQPIYESKIFSIQDQNSKYSNFLLGLIRVHNKCLVDCFGEFLQKQRIQWMQIPWDSVAPCKTKQEIFKKTKKQMPKIVNKINKKIAQISNKRLGRLYSKDIDVQQANLLQSIEEDYKNEGKDLGQNEDYLEIRLELSFMITQELIEQLVQQMKFFY